MTVIITRTPFRISFVGGGSDFEGFYRRTPGAVLSTTVNLYMYISTHRFYDEDTIVAKYSRTEIVKKLEQLRHPIIREVLRMFDVSGALEITSNADIAAGTGMGSSSAFTVGLLHNLFTAAGRLVTREQLARTACEIEITRLREPIGKQDQYAAAYGGLNVITFLCSDDVTVEPVHLRKEIHERLQRNLVLFYLGKQRKAAAVLAEQKEGLESRNSFPIVQEMVALVHELRDVLHNDKLEQFGPILHRNWLLKKKLASRISNATIESIYEKALQHGATGGKLLGAGGTGVLLFYCEQERQDRLRDALSPLKQLKFRFEGEGSKIIYVGDEYSEH